MTTEKDIHVIQKEGPDWPALPAAPDTLINMASVKKWAAMGLEGKPPVFIKPAVARKFILALANKLRYHKFSRVDAGVLYELNASLELALDEIIPRNHWPEVKRLALRVVRQRCHRIIQRNPSMGRTLR